MSKTRQPIRGLVVLLACSWALALSGPSTALTSENPDTSWRWIGIKQDAAIHAPCPVPQAPWTVQPLFDGPFVAESLEAFCLYEHKSHGLSQSCGLGCSCELNGSCVVDPNDVQHFLLDVVELKLKEIAPDQMALGLAATDLQELVQDDVHRFFLDQAGSFERPISPLPSSPRLALLDSKASATANPNDLPSRSTHGESLLAMAKNLLCDPQSGSCSAKIKTRLTLPYVLTVLTSGTTLVTRDDVRGGHVGTIGELAKAIHGEVQSWLLTAPSPGAPSDRLILNLSLAWTPRWSGEVDARGQGLPAAAAVFRALQDATCKGVLAITAVGNRSDGPYPSRSLGPLLPAAWERYAAPDLATCQQLGSSTPDLSIFPGQAEAYRPLVYAVGGITSTGQPLVNGRDLSTPPRVAFGGPAIANSSSSRHPLTILTGSSVATLIVSAITAAVWADKPVTSPHKIMDLVDLAGEQLAQQPRLPDLCQLIEDGARCSDKRPEVRRVSLCSSLDDINNCPPWRDDFPDFSRLDFSKIHAEAKRFSKDSFLLQGLEPVCQTDSFYFQSGPSMSPCPQLQLAGIQGYPWVFPQPQSIPCPPCHMLGEEAYLQRLTPSKGFGISLIHIELDDSFRDLQLGAATLTFCPGSAESQVYSLDAWDSPRAGDKVVIMGLERPSCQQATLSFSITDSSGRVGSVSSPITVIP